MSHPKNWIEIKPQGLYCTPGDFFIDPIYPVDAAIITHGHADHARSGHKRVLATPATIAIMKARYGENCAEKLQPLDYRAVTTINGVKIYFLPAGHILGSAQAVLEYKNHRIIISGDYKRAPDPTCEAFTPEHCDVFITEATFSLPVFKHPPIQTEIAKLINSLYAFPDHTHLVGAYALGKCQRLIMELRVAGYDQAIYLHGAQIKLCNLYQEFGINLGELLPVDVEKAKTLGGQIVICPPSALQDRWSRRFPQVIHANASGWMQIRARAKQKGIELPLIISDHADWYELIQTLDDVAAPEVWVTHGREEALVHYALQKGFKAQALSLLGYEDSHEGEE